MDKEIWKTCPDYTFVEVSNLGNVRTKDRIVTRSNGRRYFVKGRVLKQQLNKNGYMYVEFSVNNKIFRLSTHRMSAITFIPNPNNYPEVNHKDNNPKNNAVSNLEWCTRQYNIAYREKYGKSAKKVSGQPMIAVDLETSEVFRFESQSEVSQKLGVDRRLIYAVLKGKQNKTHGWWFCYADSTAVEKTRSKFGDELAAKVEKLIHEHQ